MVDCSWQYPEEYWIICWRPIMWSSGSIFLYMKNCLLRRLRKQQIGRITNMHWDAEWYWMIHHIPNIPQLSLERRRYALLHLQLNVWRWHIDYFIAYNNCKDTIVALNTSKDHGKSVRYYLQQPGKNAQQIKNILVVDDEYDINLTLECILNQSGFKVYSFTNPLIALESVSPASSTWLY
jgi:hypothetical protein